MNVFRPKFAAAGLPTNLRNMQLASFFGFIFGACWIKTLKVNADRKIEQFFAGFFHISKRRKTARQLNRTETLKPGEKNAHVIFFTHGRA